MSLEPMRRLWQERFGRPEPGKLICVGLNYRDHAAESGAESAGEPLLFGRFANALCGPGDPTVLPLETAHVDAEAELVIVIEARGRRVAAAEA